MISLFYVNGAANASVNLPEIPSSVAAALYDAYKISLFCKKGRENLQNGLQSSWVLHIIGGIELFF
jgi:hypothetical protein